MSEGALSAAEQSGSGYTFWCQGGESHRKYLVSYPHLVQNPCFKHSIYCYLQCCRDGAKYLGGGGGV